MYLAAVSAGRRRPGGDVGWHLAAAGWLFLLALLALLLGDSGTRALVCLPCDESKCEEPKSCPGSIVLGICGCCFMCARQRNESCGGVYGLHGACDRGLRCVIRPPLNGDSITEYEVGVCEDENWDDDQLLGFEPCNENLITGCNIINGKCECDTIRTCNNPFEFPSRDTCLSALKRIEVTIWEELAADGTEQSVLQMCEILRIEGTIAVKATGSMTRERELCFLAEI
ncbi:cysteine-rich motor neuron 1 protein-like protein [Pitangus sulphuratus]|nr:cysteine-rich motor neuron 1 protein-like protein [Pitangus sulphuratus]